MEEDLAWYPSFLSFLESFESSCLPAQVWGWVVASIFILIVGLAMAELASAAPTSGTSSSINHCESLKLTIQHSGGVS